MRWRMRGRWSSFGAEPSWRCEFPVSVTPPARELGWSACVLALALCASLRIRALLHGNTKRRRHSELSKASGSRLSVRRAGHRGHHNHCARVFDAFTTLRNAPPWASVEAALLLGLNNEQYSDFVSCLPPAFECAGSQRGDTPSSWQRIQ